MTRDSPTRFLRRMVSKMLLKLLLILPRGVTCCATPASLSQILRYAKSLHSKRDYQGVVNLLAPRVSEIVNNEDLVDCLVEAYQAEGRVDEILDLRRRVLESAPNDHDLYDTYAWTLDRHGREAEAASAYATTLALIDRALEDDPHNPDLHMHKSYTLNELDRDEEARQSFLATSDLYATLYAKTQERRHGLNCAKAMALGDRKVEAAKLLEQIVTANPDYASAWSALGMIYVRQGEADRALAAYRTAIKILPFAPDLVACALIEMKRGEFDSALRHIDEAWELEPGSVEVHYFRGKLFALRGDVDLFDNECDTVRRLNPKAADILIAQVKAGHPDTESRDMTTLA